MFLTPDKAKSIAEQFAGTEPVLSQKGPRKGAHVKYAYRFKYDGDLTRHLSISSRQTEEGVTVYINNRSTRDSMYPEAELKPARVTKTYPKGSQGKTGDKGLSTAAAGLPTLDPEDNDVLKLSVPTVESFQRVLAWYFGKPSARGMDASGSQEAEAGSTPFRKEADPIPPGTNNTPVSPVAAEDQYTLDRDTPTLRTDEQEAVVKVRFGQGSFREALFRHYKSHGEKCWMSGIEGKRLLIASHIKPWSHCKEETGSRGNPDNGLLLSALWDSVFDAGLISFDSDWKVVASSELSESARCALNLKAHTELPIVFRTAGRKAYLAYHRAKVFEYWKVAEQERCILPVPAGIST